MANVMPNPPSGSDVFDRIARDVVSGKYAPGSRLPAERELARALGTSRPTVREALRRLVEWRLVEARRGSGIVVRPRRDWSLEVLPTFLLFGAPFEGPEALKALIRDLLAVRRGLLVEVLRVIGGRVAPGSLDAARAHAQAAWDARDRPAEFVRHDFEAMRSIVEAADFLPALWLLGGVAHVYQSMAERITGGFPAPPVYLKALRSVFDALEAGRTEVACKALAEYLDVHDRRLLAALGVGHE